MGDSPLTSHRPLLCLEPGRSFGIRAYLQFPAEGRARNTWQFMFYFVTWPHARFPRTTRTGGVSRDMRVCFRT